MASPVTEVSFRVVSRTVEEIYKDFRARRSALVRALTVDVDKLYWLCDPEKDNLCLFGRANGTWEVAMPADNVPPQLPEPVIGINFSRDGMLRRDWLRLIAIHSDSWLLSVAFFLGASLNGNERKRLFSLINDHPTVLEALCDHRMHGRDNKSGIDSGSKSSDFGKKENDPPTHNMSLATIDEEHNDETFCGTCDGRYYSDEFWIGCDTCDRWFHGECVRITPEKAEHIMHYKCPECKSSKKSRKYNHGAPFLFL
ncbi:hypothetical protein GUJ93_ZPchr0013g36536 [Zizania palustris]|uniref:PHD finger protein ALFIN-LIKE n=1 Tax=Zizania palustris TaxID=103762 RepID=A0A8J6C5M6_ZIZPA|nr:hypothetical protein GUJ93_ZPchr0013g36536 [Zizania palustris]